MGTMHVLCSAGDVTVEWDPEDDESITKAKAEWKRLKTEGYDFYSVTEVKGERVTRFSKALGKVIAAPGIAKPKERKTTARPKAMRGGPNARQASLHHVLTERVVDADDIRGAFALLPGAKHRAFMSGSLREPS